MWRRFQPVGFRPCKHQTPQAEACATICEATQLRLGFRFGFIPDVVVEPALFRGRTDLLENCRFRIDEGDGVGHPGLGIRFWIGERHVEFQRVLVHAPVTLHEMHLVAVGIAEMIDPRSVIVADGLYDKSISVPFAD